MFSVYQSVWGGHRSHLHPQHVHSVSCARALWLRHIRQNFTGARGGEQVMVATELTSVFTGGNVTEKKNANK